MNIEIDSKYECKTQENHEATRDSRRSNKSLRASIPAPPKPPRPPESVTKRVLLQRRSQSARVALVPKRPTTRPTLSYRGLKYLGESSKRSMRGQERTLHEESKTVNNTSSTNPKSQHQVIGMGKARYGYSGKSISFVRGQTVEILSHNEGEELDTETGDTLWVGRVINEGKTQIGSFPSSQIHIIKSKTPNYRDLVEFTARAEGRYNKLFRTVTEFVESEARHVSDLVLVNVHFIEPFRKEYGEVMARKVFSDWEALTKVHEQFLYRLVEGLPKMKDFERCEGTAWNPRVQAYAQSDNENCFGQVSSRSPDSTLEGLSAIRRHISLLEYIHREFFSNFLFLAGADTDIWLGVLESMTSSLCQAVIEMNEILKICIPCVTNQSMGVRKHLKKKHLQFIIRCEDSSREALNYLNLDAFLIKPMQRITRYPLLMREIFKQSQPILEQASIKASSALDKLSFIVNYVNGKMETSPTILLSEDDSEPEEPPAAKKRSSSGDIPSGTSSLFANIISKKTLSGKLLLRRTSSLESPNGQEISGTQHGSSSPEGSSSTSSAPSSRKKSYLRCAELIRNASSLGMNRSSSGGRSNKEEEDGGGGGQRHVVMGSSAPPLGFDEMFLAELKSRFAANIAAQAV